MAQGKSDKEVSWLHRKAFRTELWKTFQHISQELKEEGQANAGSLSLAAEYFSKSSPFKLFLQAHRYPPSRPSCSPLLLHSQSSSVVVVPCTVTESHSSALFCARDAPHRLHNVYTQAPGFCFVQYQPSLKEQWLDLEQLLSSCLRWFSEGQELSFPRRTIRGWRTIMLYYLQSDKSLLGKEVHNNSRHT